MRASWLFLHYTFDQNLKARFFVLYCDILSMRLFFWVPFMLPANAIFQLFLPDVIGATICVI